MAFILYHSYVILTKTQAVGGTGILFTICRILTILVRTDAHKPGARSSTHLYCDKRHFICLFSTPICCVEFASAGS